RIRQLGAKSALTIDAEYILTKLGTNASPAMPKLIQLAQGAEPCCQFAMDLLAGLGEEGLSSVASIARSTNAAKKKWAYVLLRSHYESMAARSAMTNALTDPDPEISRNARIFLFRFSRREKTFTDPETTH